MNWWQRRGLRFRLALLVALILVAVLGAILVGVSLYIQAQLWSREQQMAIQMNSLVVASLEDLDLAHDHERVQQVIETLGRSEQAHIEDIAIYAKIEERIGTVLYRRNVLVNYATNFPGGRDIPRADLEEEQNSPSCWTCHRYAPEQRPAAAPVFLEGQEVMRTVLPIEQNGQIVGISLVDFDLDNYHRTATLVRWALAAGGTLAIAVGLVALVALLSRTVVMPLRDLLAMTRSMARGEWGQRVPVRTRDELGKLGEAFNEMSAQLAATYADLQEARLAEAQRAADLQRALDEIQQGQDEQARLLETIRQMSTPVVPVERGVLVMPLVGIIDTPRAQGIIQTLLTTIEEEQARVVILDITGVPVVDTAVAQTLLQAALAARLLGAETVLVGISPQVAETIVSLGVDLSGLVTRADLQSGVEYARRRLRI